MLREIVPTETCELFCPFLLALLLIDRFDWYLPEPYFIVFATRHDLLTVGPKRHRVHRLRVPDVLAEELAGAEVPESSRSVRASREQESVVCRDRDGVDPVGVSIEGPNQLSVGDSPEASNVFTVSASQSRANGEVRSGFLRAQRLPGGTA